MRRNHKVEMYRSDNDSASLGEITARIMTTVWKELSEDMKNAFETRANHLSSLPLHVIGYDTNEFLYLEQNDADGLIAAFSQEMGIDARQRGRGF